MFTPICRFAYQYRPGFARFAPMPPTSAARWKTSSGRTSAKQARGVVPAGQVVVGPARHERVLALRPEAVDEVRAEEAAAAGDEDPAHVFAGARFSQSTRPIQRSRFSAYQRIVRRTPSSQLTFGSQPVSRFSFS